MKKGDMVKLCEVSYTQYKGELCMIMNEMEVDQWVVLTRTASIHGEFTLLTLPSLALPRQLKHQRLKKLNKLLDFFRPLWYIIRVMGG